jgi:condensin complex subunit 3
LRNVPSLDDELYTSIKVVLLERGTDREWTIRSAACPGLGVLARGEISENSDSDDDEEAGSSDIRISTVLQALCQYDPHPHVRISCLPGMSIPLTASTLPLLLSRTRDSDSGVRKMSFRLLQQVPVRGLTVAQRSLLVKNGLGDREASVRMESSKLIYQWAIACSDYSGAQPKGNNSRRDAAQRLEAKIDLDEFLDLFDLWDGEVAEEALKALVYKRPNVLDGLDLSQGG